jgi:hypothetical protein
MAPKILSFSVVAVLALFAMSQSVEAVTIPAWCNCSDNTDKTQKACRTASGNWDGNSCGLDNIGKYNAFLPACANLGGQYRCWH